MRPDLLVIGGGIIGCSAAAFAAERGASVLVLEREALGAGASGRNSGAVQHPFDPILAPLHRATLAIYHDLSGTTPDFAIGAEPAGLLLLTDDADAARERAAELRADEPQLEAEFLDEAMLAELEPMLARPLYAIRLATGFPVPPAAATLAMAARARRARAELQVGVLVARVMVEGGRAGGVLLADGSRIDAGAVLVAAGPWSDRIVDPDGGWRPMRPTHGVTVQLSLPAAPRSVLEEGTVHTVNRPVSVDEAPDGLLTFSLVSAGGVSTLGSTFLSVAPDPAAMAPQLVAHGARFVPALSRAPVLRSRVCTRPQSVDGRPFIGPVAGIAGLFVCAGHGPWGISTGPASAAVAVDAIMSGGSVPLELEASRPT